MGTTERRRRERERKEEEIVEGAKRLFVMRGFAATTVDDIIDALEISKGSLYHHFGGKDELFYAAAGRPLTRIRDEFAAIRSGGGTGLERLTAMGSAYMRMWNDDPDHRRLLRDIVLVAPPSGPRGEQFARTGEEAGRLMVETVEEGMADGSIRRDLSPEMIAFTVSSALDGALNALERGGHKVMAMGGREKVMDLYFGLLRDAVAAGPRSGGKGSKA